MVLPSPRVQTAPLVQGSGSENNREVHSSPPVVSLTENRLSVIVRYNIPSLQQLWVLQQSLKAFKPGFHQRHNHKRKHKHLRHVKTNIE